VSGTSTEHEVVNTKQTKQIRPFAIMAIEISVITKFAAEIAREQPSVEPIKRLTSWFSTLGGREPSKEEALEQL
jgi:hypothetical protein